MEKQNDNRRNQIPRLTATAATKQQQQQQQQRQQPHGKFHMRNKKKIPVDFSHLKKIILFNFIVNDFI